MHDAEWFKQQLGRLRLKQDDLAGVLHCDRSVVSRIMSGDQQLRLDQVLPLADALRVSEFEILYRAGMWGDRPPAPVRLVPILSEVQAGEFVEPPPVPPASDSGVFVQHPRDTLFALIVRGDSMDRIAPEGSAIVVDYSERDLLDNQLGVFRQENGEATFKRLRRSDVESWLQPDSNNPRHVPIFPRQGQRIEVIGRVVAIRPEYAPDEPPADEPAPPEDPPRKPPEPPLPTQSIVGRASAKRYGRRAPRK